MRMNIKHTKSCFSCSVDGEVIEEDTVEFDWLKELEFEI